MTTSPKYCEVLIVGAGPAGSTCARQLARHGFDVILMDKARFPRDKVCAGWITPQVVESTAIDLEEYGKSRTLQPISAFRVGLLDRDSILVGFDSVVSYGIRRREFDEFLLRRAGCEIIEGEAVRSICCGEEDWTINGSIHARFLIGAGGHYCPVARWLQERGARGSVKHETVVVAQEIEYEMSAAERRGCRVQPNTPELYFYPDFKGYAWCFRKGSFLNIGLGRTGERALSAHRDHLVNSLLSTRRIGARPTKRFKGHAYRLNVRSHDTRIFDRGLLIGDAAGLAGARSGEGIRPAIESALVAADVIAASSSDLSQLNLNAYTSELDKRHPASADVANNLMSSLRCRVGTHLLSRHWFVRRFVLDDWFLNRSLPAYRTRELGRHGCISHRSDADEAELNSRRPTMS